MQRANGTGLVPKTRRISMGEQSEVGVCNWIGAAEGEEESGGGKSYQHPLLKLACTPVVLDNGEIYLK